MAWRGWREGVDGAYLRIASCLPVVIVKGQTEWALSGYKKEAKQASPMKSATHFKLVIYGSCKHMTGLGKDWLM